VKSGYPFFVFLFFSLSLPLFSQAQQLNFKNYSVEDGVAQSQVYSLCEDSRGFLWIGTRGGGITRYDGLNFKTYTTHDGLSSNYISCILEDSSHLICIGTNNGLSLYDGAHFKSYFPEPGNSSVHVQAMTRDKSGVLWLATNTGIFIFNGTTLKRFEPCFVHQNVLCISSDHTGAIWAASTEEGLIKINRKIPDGPFEIEAFAKGSGLGKIAIQCIQEDSRGHMWVGTFGMGCFVFNGSSFIRSSKNKELDSKRILDIKPDTKGNMWVATLTDGVCRWDPNDSTLLFLKEKDGLSNNHVRCILQDSRGDYWFGTSGGGLSKYSGQPFTNYTKNNGLSSNFIYSVFRDSQQRLWLGTGEKGVCEYDGKSFVPFGQEQGFHNVKVKSIAEDANGIVWFGTDGQGVYLYNEKEFRPIQGLHGKYIRAILKDSKQNMWVATAGAGIYRLNTSENKKKTYEITATFHSLTGSPQDRISCLAEDAQGRIWFGTETKGVGFIENNRVIRTFSQRDGLASEQVRSLVLDKSGNLWIGTADAGVSRLLLSDNRFQFETINQSDGLISANVYLLATDENNTLFIGTESGLDKLKMDQEVQIPEIKHFGKKEGFSGIETCQNSVFSDNNGEIWFGTINGLTSYNPRNKTKNLFPPALRINSISLFYQPIEKTAYAGCVGPWGELAKPLVFPYGQNHIGFDFEGINLSSPENVLYEWKLNNFDQNWSPASTRHEATYSNLPPGDYTFEFKAANEDGVWSPVPFQLHFLILKPFWRRTWFIFLCSGLTLFLGMLLLRRRDNRIKKKSLELQNKLATEKLLIELEQKALRLQMNPHFIFNALNSIQASISQNKEDSARYYLAKFSKLMRLILEHSSFALIPLEEEIKVLELYLSIEKFSGGNQFDYHISMETGLPIGELSLPPMMIQPFVENSIIHGFRGLGKRGEISLMFQIKDGFLECRVTDNGIGRTMARQNNLAQQDQHHKATALRVTQERLDILNGGNNIKSLEIFDLTDESGMAHGTEVLLRVPLQ
jgi:ligand-binding sensor domain-containing protein